MNRTWTKLLLDLLKDGEWHDYETVIAQCYDEVDDEEAFEIGEYYRCYRYIRADRLIPQSKFGRGRTIRAGKHILVTRSVTKLKNRAMIEIESEPQGRKHRRNKPLKIRLRMEE